MSYYRIVGNFRDFHDQTPARKICSHENFFLQNVLANKSSTVPSSRRSSKLSES